MLKQVVVMKHKEHVATIPYDTIRNGMRPTITVPYDVYCAIKGWIHDGRIDTLKGYHWYWQK